ncbi:MAG: ribose 1,5-bisphosphate isomerase [Hadesarchaea archaeon]|nr:MAG: ribose 1,5-bisphosphate isomerase [Hadesarchaea archaeon]
MEAEIAAKIIEEFSRELLKNLKLDVAVVGAGPAGLTAARYLAKEGKKVAVFEKNLWVGGGMWGGGILFPKLVVEREAADLLREVGVKLQGEGSLLTADAVEVVAKCTSSALDAGAKIFVGMEVEDLMVKNSRVCGVVLNWRAVNLARMHVDPIGVEARVVIDATGHEAFLARVLERKLPGVRFPTSTGKIVGEGPMDAEVAEREIVENTREIYPGLVVAGMTAGAVFGSPRMGPVFGGMLLSGKKAAGLALKLLT